MFLYKLYFSTDNCCDFFLIKLSILDLLVWNAWLRLSTLPKLLWRSITHYLLTIAHFTQSSSKLIQLQKHCGTLQLAWWEFYSVHWSKAQFCILRNPKTIYYCDWKNNTQCICEQQSTNIGHTQQLRNQIAKAIWTIYCCYLIMTLPSLSINVVESDCLSSR